MQNFPNRKNVIEAWFHDHDDGEFSVLPDDHPSLIVGDLSTAESVIYITKYHSLSKIQGMVPQRESAITFARYGLPLERDVQFILQLGKVSTFIGDADSPDLLIFAYLRETIPIQWGGVSDEFLERHGTRNVSRISIAMSESEIAAKEIVHLFLPNYREILGAYCASLFEQGLKIELEGALVDCL